MMRNNAFRTAYLCGLCLLLGCLLLAGCTAAESTAEPVQDTPSVAEPAPAEKTDTPSEEPDGTPVPADGLTLGQGTAEIAALVGGAEAENDPMAFAETYGLLLPLEAYDLNAPMTYREAVLVLYNALTRAPHDFRLEVVALDRRAEGLSDGDDAQRAVLFLYRRGILYRDEPADWNASIPAAEWAELLARLQDPELRAELTPDQPTRVACKLREAFRCGCVQWVDGDQDLDRVEAGFAALLLGLENPEPLLWNSFWFLERDGAGTYYLTAFSAADGATISLRRFSYDPETDQGAELEAWTPQPCSLSQTEADFAAGLVRSVCLTGEGWDDLTERLLPQFLQAIRDNPTYFSPLMAETCVGYVAPRWDTPGLLLIGLEDGVLHAQTLFEQSGGITFVDDQLAPSWYHLYD